MNIGGTSFMIQKNPFYYIMTTFDFACTQNLLFYTCPNLFANITIVTQNSDKLTSKLIILYYLFDNGTVISVESVIIA